jgi:hypothetical protein
MALTGINLPLLTTASFERSTPCAPNTADIDDAEEEEEEEEDEEDEEDEEELLFSSAFFFSFSLRAFSLFSSMSLLAVFKICSSVL